MKATTLQKKIETHLCNKNGELLCKFFMLQELLLNGKYYGKFRRGHGRFVSLSDCRHYNAIKALELLGVDYTTGNDAPRGGKTGDFVELTEKGRRQVREWVKVRRAEIDEKARIENEKAAAERAAKKNAITAMVEFLEAHPTEFDEVFHGVSKGYLSKHSFGGKIHRLAHNLHQNNNEIFHRAVNIYNGDETSIRYYNNL